VTPGSRRGGGSGAGTAGGGEAACAIDTGPCDEVRRACAAVMAEARHVRIDPARLEAVAAALAEASPPAPSLDPAHHHLGDPASTLAYVLTLDAINFGSGWFPSLRKRPGLSGYFTVATGLKERFAARGPWSAAELEALEPGEIAAVLGQDPRVPEVALLELFARALRDLGRFLREGYGGRFEGPVEEAGGSAQALVSILARMPFFEDVARWRGRRVPFYKRAQLTAADLSLALGGEGLGAFRDLERLTIFADNLVPHVLRCDGVLVYDASVAARIDAGEPLPAHSEEEIEIRAGAVHACEGLVEELRARGVATTARDVDYLLWNRGQAPAMKARPRHRTRTVFY